MSAISIEPTSNIEARLTRIGSEVAHPGTGSGEMRIDMREVARKIDTLTPLSMTSDLRVDVRDVRGEVRDMRNELRDLRVELRIDVRDLSRRVDHQLDDLVGSQAAMLTIVLGTMAKGFHWL